MRYLIAPGERGSVEVRDRDPGDDLFGDGQEVVLLVGRCEHRGTALVLHTGSGPRI